MPVELKVPKVGESITEVQLGDWLRSEGEAVDRDQPVVVIETDKATVEVPAPVAGRVVKRLKKKGEIARVGEVIGYMEEGPVPAAVKGAPAAKVDVQPKVTSLPPPGTSSPVTAAYARIADADPGARRVPPSKRRNGDAPEVAASAPVAPVAAAVPAVAPPHGGTVTGGAGREEEVVPMTLLRRKIAERLVYANQNYAILTTFNEIDMTSVMALRKQHQDAFVAKYGVKLGFMSFFVKAAIDALRLMPQVNAEIRGTDIVYHNFYDIGIAVGGGKGLVVPVLRNTERMSFAEVELAIAAYAKKAQENKLTPDDLKGGTFTISNGGIYGSLMSTPIVNPPQAGILGLHAIQDRPVARDGQVVILPMMYVALSYDHRLIDGRESVTFLKRIKDTMEDPARMLVEV